MGGRGAGSSIAKGVGTKLNSKTGFTDPRAISYVVKKLTKPEFAAETENYYKNGVIPKVLKSKSDIQHFKKIAKSNYDFATGYIKWDDEHNKVR